MMIDVLYCCTRFYRGSLLTDNVLFYVNVIRIASYLALGIKRFHLSIQTLEIYYPELWEPDKESETANQRFVL